MAKKTKKQQVVPQVIVPQGQLYKSLGDIAESAYFRFGDYANNHRQLPDVRDGIKVSYRRVLTAALEHPMGAHISTATLLGELSSRHPHSTDGCITLINNFVHSGIFDGDGNFGEIYVLDGDSTESAAPRYTKVCISQKYRKILGDLVKDVPWNDSPVEKKEPDFLPTPLPLAFILKYHMQGLGVALRTEIPSFSMKSLYQALIHDDPNLLESGVDLILDKSRSDLVGLWTKGTAKITYSYHLSRVTSDDGKTEGILFQGDTGVFQVKLSKKLKKLQEEGKITIDNVSDMNGPKMLISRVPGARGVTIDDVAKLCEEVCRNTTQYTLNVTNSETCFQIPLREWLRYTYDNYLKLLQFSVSKKIAQTEFDIKVQTAMPVVAQMIMANPKVTNTEIQKTTGYEIEVIEAIMAKPIGQLRKNKDNSDRIKALKERLKNLKAFDPVKHTEEVINEF
jgi:DNA gyrase subunit A